MSCSVLHQAPAYPRYDRHGYRITQLAIAGTVWLTICESIGKALQTFTLCWSETAHALMGADGKIYLTTAVTLAGAVGIGAHFGRQFRYT